MHLIELYNVKMNMNCSIDNITKDKINMETKQLVTRALQ